MQIGDWEAEGLRIWGLRAEGLEVGVEGLGAENCVLGCPSGLESPSLK